MKMIWLGLLLMFASGVLVGMELRGAPSGRQNVYVDEWTKGWDDAVCEATRTFALLQCECHAYPPQGSITMMLAEQPEWCPR